MDAIFVTEDPNTWKQIIGSLAQSFGCVYVCLWSYYFPRPSNYLISLDGYYHEATVEPSSSFRSLARSLFQEYRQSIIPLHNRHVPSMAFMNNLPYLEIHPQDHLQTLAYNDTQRLFYQEARIQTVIFMGCRSGEIELGMSYDPANMKIEASLREWFLYGPKLARPIYSQSQSQSPVQTRSKSADCSLGLSEPKPIRSGMASPSPFHQEMASPSGGPDPSDSRSSDWQPFGDLQPADYLQSNPPGHCNPPIKGKDSATVITTQIT